MCGKWASIAIVLVVSEIGAFQQDKRLHQRALRTNHEVHHNATSSSSPYCDTNQLIQRLSILDAHSKEQSEFVHLELRDTNRRLQGLEWQATNVHNALEGFKNKLERYYTTSHVEKKDTGVPDGLELKIENLTKGLQVVVDAVGGIKTDIDGLKKNISNIEESTKSLALDHEALVTKTFLTDSLADLAHFHLPQSVPSRPHAAEDVPENCQQVHERGNNVSGIYRIQPELAPRAFMVMCDMESRGGGWTYIHNRYEGMQDFYLNWHSYKIGFGNLGGEFWLGLEYLHQLTGYEVNELLVELVDVGKKQVYAHYGAFSVGSEAEGYALKVLGGYDGDAGDSLIYHAGSKFSTKDIDQDEWHEGSCAQTHTGAWWYGSCDHSNLNGRYLKGEVLDVYKYQGMYWDDFRGPQYSLLKARMMVRPRNPSHPSLLPNQDEFSWN